MATVGSYNKKNPTLKRILKEASELASSPSVDCHAEPLETNLFEWHFTLRGPPLPSHYAGGIYHGRIVLPPTYPLRPPSFRFLTPNGRFEVNREICLSISGHHEETWQPAWGIRTALVAIRSFMDTDAMGQLGGLVCDESLRRKMANESVSWQCVECAKSNTEIMRAREVAAKELDLEFSASEQVPAELKLSFRDELDQSRQASASSATRAPPAGPVQPPSEDHGATASSSSARSDETERTRASKQSLPPDTLTPPNVNAVGIPAWIDKAIMGVVVAIALMILRRLF